MFWTYKNKKIHNIEDIKKIYPKAYGFVYLITLLDKNSNESCFFYIGKKNLYTKRKRNFGKKEKSLIKDKRKKTYEVVVKESDWKSYSSSNKFIKDNLDNYNIKKEIILFSDSDSNLSYSEAKEIICQNALENPLFLNNNVSIRRIINKNDK